MSKFEQSAFADAKFPRDVGKGQPVFLGGDEEASEEDVAESHGMCRQESDFAIAHLNLRKSQDLRKRGKEDSRCPFLEEIVVSEPPESRVRQKKEKYNELSLVRYGVLGIQISDFHLATMKGICRFSTRLSASVQEMAESQIAIASLTRLSLTNVGISWARSGVFLPETDHLRPINFLCGNCPESSLIKESLDIKKSSIQTIRQAISVNDLILRPELVRRKVLTNCRNPPIDAHVYNILQKGKVMVLPNIFV